MTNRAPSAHLGLARGGDLDVRPSLKRRLSVLALTGLFLMAFPIWLAQAAGRRRVRLQLRARVRGAAGHVALEQRAGQRSRRGRR